MTSGTIRHPSPTLLGLPIELRRQILQYAFLASCSPAPLLASAIPFGIKIYFASDFRPSHANSGIYGYWGREPMSRILRINQQFLSDAVEVLYGGDFVFEFSNTTRAGNVRFWLDLLGERKRKMVKHIGVSIVVDLKMLSVIGDAGSEAAKREIGFKKEAWSILREELEGLKSVQIEIGFVRRMKGGQPGRERLLDDLVGLVKLFQGVETVLVDGDRMNEERVSILETCKERLGVERGEEARSRNN